MLGGVLATLFVPLIALVGSAASAGKRARSGQRRASPHVGMAICRPGCAVQALFVVIIVISIGRLHPMTTERARDRRSSGTGGCARRLCSSRPRRLRGAARRVGRGGRGAAGAADGARLARRHRRRARDARRARAPRRLRTSRRAHRGLGVPRRRLLRVALYWARRRPALRRGAPARRARQLSPRPAPARALRPRRSRSRCSRSGRSGSRSTARTLPHRRQRLGAGRPHLRRACTTLPSSGRCCCFSSASAPCTAGAGRAAAADRRRSRPHCRR